MKSIVKLGRDSAVNAIKNTNEVMYKSGIWNKYQLRPTSDVISSIINSGYGADVDEDEDGVLYVCCPCSSDMW